MSDIVVTAAYGSVVEDPDDGFLFIGFAEGEAGDEPYVLFRQPLAGGPLWFEVNDETLGAEDAIAGVQAGPGGLTIAIRPEMRARLGWVGEVGIRIGPDCEDAGETLDALRAMLGPLMQG